ncbi:hypothetical protein [Xanthobacter agilis]|uniref:Uncharacterized protein n=1 Tax=Xanthobacter agilis TaxID=47492 RepID=A0ABU0LA78_XANAG|nr:hypothetical protein [Xanthobacter agilis]MDQ0504029.1 hypothetical protein [Xanthobacter agilis]
MACADILFQLIGHDDAAETCAEYDNPRHYVSSSLIVDFIFMAWLHRSTGMPKAAWPKAFGEAIWCGAELVGH